MAMSHLRSTTCRHELPGPRHCPGCRTRPELRMHHLRTDPSPTALRSPLSPWRGIKIKIPTLSLGERGDRKAVGEGSLLTQSTLTEP